MTVSELMQAMADAGAPMEAIILAVRALEEKDSALEAKRAVERDRKRRQRSRVEGEAGTVTGQSRDTDGTVPDAAEMVSPNEYISNPLPDSPSPKGDSPKKKSRAPRSMDFEVPSWVPAEPWAAFVAMRRQKKKPVDSYMANRHFGKLRTIADAGWNLSDVIDKATNGFWDGFWMPDGKDPSIRRANDGTPLAAADKASRIESRAALMESMGRTDDAEEFRRQAAELRAPRHKGPPRAVGQLVQGLMEQARPA